MSQEVRLRPPFLLSTREFLITPEDFDAGAVRLYRELWKDEGFKRAEKLLYSVIIPFVERYRKNTLKVLGVFSLAAILLVGSYATSQVIGTAEQQNRDTVADTTTSSDEAVGELEADVLPFVQDIGQPVEVEIGGQVVHVVQQGENLFRLAQRYGVTVDAVVQVNGIPDADMIFIGQRLIIPALSDENKALQQFTQVVAADSLVASVDQVLFPVPPQTVTIDMIGRMVTSHHYCVDQGETLSQIAQRFGVSVTQLVEWNNLSNQNYIQFGQFLIVKQPS